MDEVAWECKLDVLLRPRWLTIHAREAGYPRARSVEPTGRRVTLWPKILHCREIDSEGRLPPSNYPKYLKRLGDGAVQFLTAYMRFFGPL